MTYFSDYELVFLDIMKNGSSRFISLFEYVLGKEKDNPVFVREPQLFITVVRNPYDRLVSQFYHINRSELYRNYRYTIHYPLFREWVKKTYENGYDGDDGHIYAQNHIIQYYKYPDLPYHIFKLEELKPYELFFFLGELSDERKADIDKKYKELGQLRIDDGHYTAGNMKQGIWEIFHNQETIKICNDYFAKDFEAFGYDMIDPLKWETPKRSML
jgi:hypothetical protein